MKLKLIFVAACLSTLAACSTTTNTDGASKYSKSAKAQGYRCKKAVKLGSHIGSKRCTTKKQRTAEREAAQKTIGDFQGNGPKKVEQGGL